MIPSWAGRVRGRWSQARQRVRSWLQGSPAGLVAVALAVGVGAGAGAVVFRYLILWCTRLFTGHADYAGAGHAANPWFPQLGFWFVVFAPVLGGLVYGPLVEFFAREARGHGVPEVMLAVAKHGGRIRPQVAAIKSLASAICIGSGGSVGREGPIVQIGSALGSTLGQVLGLSDARLRLLVACGAAAGISATFNAPIAGVLFALELILRDFEAESFGVVVLASVVADVIGRAAFGSAAFLALPPLPDLLAVEYPLYAGLGLVAAARRRRLHPRPLRPRGSCRPSLDGPGVAPPRRRRPGARACCCSRCRRCTASATRCSRRRSAATTGPWFLLLLLGREDRGDEPTHRDRRLGRRLRAVALHGRRARHRVRPGVAHSLLPGIDGARRDLRTRRHGRRLRGGARAPITAVIIIFELTGDYRSSCRSCSRSR